MSEIKALEDMRKELRVCGCDPDECIGCSVPGKVREHADRIEAEIAERFVELPVGDDGEALEIGDELDCLGNRVLLNSLSWNGKDWYATETVLSSGWYEACNCHHVKPRTLEGVLRDVWKEALDYAKSDMWRNPDEVFAERAAEIRELLGVGE